MADPFSISIIPRSHGVYAMRDRGGHIIYVGISKNIRSRIDQHLNRRDSSVSTGVAAAMLNADKVASVVWWQHIHFDDPAILEAAEIVAFEILNPVLRSRGNVTERALLHLENQVLVDELKALFQTDNKDRYIPKTLDNLADLMMELRDRISAMDGKQ